MNWVTRRTVRGAAGAGTEERKRQRSLSFWSIQRVIRNTPMRRAARILTGTMNLRNMRMILPTAMMRTTETFRRRIIRWMKRMRTSTKRMKLSMRRKKSLRRSFR